MSKTVAALEKELEDIKKKELKEKWEVYLDKVKSFITRLEGKTVISHYCNGGFILYKVLGYEEKYYIDRDGWSGQWSPCRWLEIKTTSYVECRVADDRGRWFGGKIEHSGGYSFKAAVYKGKSFPKDLEMSKIDFKNLKVTESGLSTINDVVKIGYTEYTEYRQDPNYERAMERFLLFTQLAPEGMWEKAKEIADDNFTKTKSFWEEFEPKCKGLKSLYNEIPF